MKKRSVKIAGHATSISLEEEFWAALKNLAEAQNMSINRLITLIDEKRKTTNLSSALRIYVLESLLNEKKPSG